MSGVDDVLAVLRKASRSVPNDDFVAFDDAFSAVAELIEFKRMAMHEFEYLQSRREFSAEDRERWAALANVGGAA